MHQSTGYTATHFPPGHARHRLKYYCQYPGYSLLILLFWGIQQVYAQPLSFIYKTYTVKDGLADNMVLSIYQDSKGFMWFGTREGLSRFDGNHFRNYYSDNKDLQNIPASRVHYIHEYKPGHLVLLCNHELVFMNTGKNEFYSKGLWKGRYIYGISMSAANEYFITTTDTIFITRDFIHITDTLVPPSSSGDTFHIVYPVEKETWVVNNFHETFLYNPLTKIYTLLYRAEEDKKYNQMRNFLYHDKKNHWLYFGSFYEGLFRYTINGSLLKHWTIGEGKDQLPVRHYNFMVPFNDSLIWLGDQELGLYSFNAYTGNYTHYPADPYDPAALSSNTLMGYYKDQAGSHWLVTIAGVSKINIISSYIKTWKNELKAYIGKGYINNLVRGSNGHYYFSSGFNSTFAELDPVTGRVTVHHTGTTSVWFMNNWGNEIVCTGGSKTATVYNPATGATRQINYLQKYFINSDLVVLALQQKNGDLWFSGNANGGLLRVDAKTGQAYHYNRENNKGKITSGYYHSYAEDKNGDLWLAVNKSCNLLHWDSKKMEFQNIDINQRINNPTLDGINDLRYDPLSHSLWIAYDGSGLMKYDIGMDTVLQYTTLNGMAGNYVYALVFDDMHRLWAATGKGLSCFNTNNGKFINFDTRNGLSEDEFTEHTLVFDSLTHNIYIAGPTTLMRFNPDSILKFAGRNYKVYLDNVLVNGKAVDAGLNQVYRLKPHENNIQFSFVAPDLINGKKMQYSYQLEGTHTGWVNNETESTVSFANLSAGEYSFRLRARPVGENEWKEMEQPFRFIIQLPWFKTWWFMICMGIAASMLLFALVRLYYRQRFEKKRIRMEKELLVEQERTRLAQELHDGLGSMLSGVKHSFSSLMNELELDAENTGRFHKNIEKLNASIREIRNISHNLYSQGLGKMGIDDLVEEYCLVKSSEQHIPILFSKYSTEQLVLTEAQSFHIFRMVQELLENIIRHSAATEALVQLSYNNHTLYITVEDNGTGFDISRRNKSKGIGLKNVETRVKSLGGNLNIKSEKGQGTSVLIEIPVK